MSLFTPGNVSTIAFSLFSCFGVVCGTYADTWCTRPASMSMGMLGVAGAAIIAVLERMGAPGSRTWTARWQQVRRQPSLSRARWLRRYPSSVFSPSVQSSHSVLPTFHVGARLETPAALLPSSQRRRYTNRSSRATVNLNSEDTTRGRSRRGVGCPPGCPGKHKRGPHGVPKRATSQDGRKSSGVPDSCTCTCCCRLFNTQGNLIRHANIMALSGVPHWQEND